ncbi:MAG: hypothetical protein KGI55_01745 [Gammaproteobacteria bacterium]|nr:hypothetical protein [Gammaproteobacteria bacterium]
MKTLTERWSLACRDAGLVPGSARGFVPVLCRAVTRMRERRFARLQASRLRDAFFRMRALHPEFSVEALYAATLKDRYRLDDAEAMIWIHRARRDRAVWPEPRALHLRDLVTHVVVNDYLHRASRRRGGTLTDMRDVVATVVPNHW